MIVFPAMHFTFNHKMQCIGRVIPLNISERKTSDERA